MSQYVKAPKSGGALETLGGAWRFITGADRPLGDFGIAGPSAILRSLRNFVVTTWDPANSDIRGGINTLIGGALRNPSPEAIENAKRRSPTCAALFEERFDPKLDVDRLLALPEGTLGRTYARFVRDNGIDPLGDLVEWGKPTNVLQYTMLRAYKLHDVLHVVLDCPATPLGEVPIVAFSVGQADAGSIANQAKATNAPALALAIVLLHIALRRPQEFAEACRLTGEWVRIGARCRPYAEFRFEEMMDEPVEVVRERVLGSARAAAQASATSRSNAAAKSWRV